MVAAESRLIELGGSGPPLHLAHGNGFPPETYRRLATILGERFRVVALATRPLVGGCDPREVASWRPLADDLLAALAEHRLGDVVAVGHSLGGVLSLLAAVAEPERFRAVALIDPVLFTGHRAWLWWAMKRLGLGMRFALARGAERRRDHWPDRQAAASSWRGKAVFTGWADGVLDDYLDAAVVDDPAGGVRLRYSKAWEGRLFAVTPHHEWRAVGRLEVPALVLRGERSITFTAAAARRVARANPRATVETVTATSHFLPMERPEEVGRRILAWLDAQSGWRSRRS